MVLPAAGAIAGIQVARILGTRLGAALAVELADNIAVAIGVPRPVAEGISNAVLLKLAATPGGSLARVVGGATIGEALADPRGSAALLFGGVGRFARGIKAGPRNPVAELVKSGEVVRRNGKIVALTPKGRALLRERSKRLEKAKAKRAPRKLSPAEVRARLGLPRSRRKSRTT